LNAETSRDEIHVDPAKGEELSSAGPGCGGEGQIEVEGRVVGHEPQKLRHLLWRGRPHLGRFTSGRTCMVGDVLEDPGPALPLGQCGMERRVDTSNGANRKRLAIDSTPRAEVFVELVDDGSREVTNQDVAQAGL